MKKILLTFALALILLLPCVGFTAETKTYTFLAPLSTSADNTPIASDLPGYLQGMFQIVLGVAGVLAVIMIMRGGIMYITAGDNESSVSEAKEIIRSAIFGLLLAILSFLIIQTLNPNALSFSIQKPTTTTPEDMSANPSVGGTIHCFYYLDANNRDQKQCFGSLNECSTAKTTATDSGKTVITDCATFYTTKNSTPIEWVTNPTSPGWYAQATDSNNHTQFFGPFQNSNDCKNTTFPDQTYLKIQGCVQQFQEAPAVDPTYDPNNPNARNS